MTLMTLLCYTLWLKPTGGDLTRKIGKQASQVSLGHPAGGCPVVILSRSPASVRWMADLVARWLID
jgi:hypothetical protein